MKKTLIAGLIALAPFSAQAAEKGPGCGLGAMVFDGQSGVVQNVLAATTNGTFGNQTFGMSSGTLGCDPNNTITTAAADIFLDENMEKVARDMSTGQGESLDTLASLIGVSEEDKSHFFSTTRQNFAKIYGGEKTSSAEVLLSLKEVMKADGKLSKYVA
ncbi:MAG TPA: DUF3015 domain-containing protein [Gammaproteobacteria bacterium]